MCYRHIFRQIYGTLYLDISTNIFVHSNITNEVEDESALLTISIFYLFNSLAFGLFSCILFQFRSVIYKLDDLSVPYDVKVGENDNDNI